MEKVHLIGTKLYVSATIGTNWSDMKWYPTTAEEMRSFWLAAVVSHSCGDISTVTQYFKGTDVAGFGLSNHPYLDRPSASYILLMPDMVYFKLTYTACKIEVAAFFSTTQRTAAFSFVTRVTDEAMVKYKGRVVFRQYMPC